MISMAAALTGHGMVAACGVVLPAALPRHSQRQACTATRARQSSSIILRGSRIIHRVGGDALSVLHTVVFDWKP